MAQNKNGPIIGLAVASLVAVGLAIFWYMDHAENQQLRAQLAAAANETQQLKGNVADQVQQLNTLKGLIGYADDADVGHGDPNDQGGIQYKVNALISTKAGDNTAVPPNLEGALLKTAAESDNNNFNASERLRQLNLAAANFQRDLQAKDTEIKTQRDAREKAEAELVKQETSHSEEMARLEQQNDQLRTEKTEIETRLTGEKAVLEQQLLDRDADIADYQKRIDELQRQKREREDESFFTPDGLVETVDHLRGLCYINIGSVDGLQVGTTFSVYTQRHSGVGRKNVSDIKGKIEVVRILGPRQAEAKFLDEKLGMPIAENDPVFSPLFQSGQRLDVAVVGSLTVDGLSRGEFHAMASRAGSRIAIEVNDEGEFTDGTGRVLTEEEALNMVNSKVRMIVVGDLGDPNTLNAELEELYQKMAEKKAALEKQATKFGIDLIPLSSFLEHIGYKRKQVTYTPETNDGFPVRLTNGARSASVNGRLTNRESSAVISGRFSGRRRQTAVSTGNVSKAYSN